MSEETKIAAKAFLDRYTEKFVSRKFLAWGVATYLCLAQSVTSSDWVAVTLAYIGSQAVVDLAVAWKKASSSNGDI